MLRKKKKMPEKSRERIRDRTGNLNPKRKGRGRLVAWLPLQIARRGSKRLPQRLCIKKLRSRQGRSYKSRTEEKWGIRLQIRIAAPE